MRTIRIAFCLFLTALSLQAAASFSRITITGSSTPADGNTLVVNGTTKTWKTTLTSSATQILIGADLATSMANLYTTLSGANGYANTTVYQPDATHVTLLGTLNATLTASVTGTWGSVAIVVSPITQDQVNLPLVTEPAATQNRIANEMVDAFTYANTSQFASSWNAMVNFVNLSLAQTITGSKTFTGATILSNANNHVHGGYVSNIIRADIALFNMTGTAMLQGVVKLTNETPYLEFFDTDASANNKRTQLYGDQSSVLVKFLNDAGSAASNVFEITKDSGFGSSGAIFRTRLKADYIYDTTLTNGLTTNMVMIHALAAILDSGMFTGNAAVSNTAPVYTLYDSDALSGSRNYQLRANANALRLSFADDAGAVPISPSGDIFVVGRTHGTDATAETISFKIPVEFLGGLSSLSSDFITSTLLRAGNGVIIGTGSGTTMPTGAAQALLLAPGTGPSGTPSGYSIRWSSGGEDFYQNGLSGEGDTLPNRSHNRTASVFGAGTDYSLLASTAFVDFGTTDPKVTLPTAGTYLIFADVALTAGATANDDYRFKLRNETTSTDLSGSDQLTTNIGIGFATMAHLEASVTVTTASNVIAIWGHNNTAARGTVNSARTRIGYVRLY